MKSALVGQPNSQFHGLRTRCCPRKTRAGQAIYWNLPAGKVTSSGRTMSWRERVFVLHATCMAEMVHRAPAGAPTRPAEIDAELAELRALALALA